MLNSREIDLLREDVAANCRLWLVRCRAAGLPALVTNTVRDTEYQAWLYQQGRTRPGEIVTNGKVPTFHGVEAGLAFDFSKNVAGHAYDDPDFFRRAAALAKEMGFTWGGDWKTFPDAPHLQWDGGGRYTNAMIRRRQYPPDMPLWREEDDVTQEQFNRMMDAWLTEQGEKAPGDWSAEARRWAEESGLIQGGVDGDRQYRSFATREQTVVLLKRLYEMRRGEQDPQGG